MHQDMDCSPNTNIHSITFNTAIELQTCITGCSKNPKCRVSMSMAIHAIKKISLAREISLLMKEQQYSLNNMIRANVNYC